MRCITSKIQISYIYKEQKKKKYICSPQDHSEEFINICGYPFIFRLKMEKKHNKKKINKGKLLSRYMCYVYDFSVLFYIKCIFIVSKKYTAMQYDYRGSVLKRFIFKPFPENLRLINHKKFCFISDQRNILYREGTCGT